MMKHSKRPVRRALLPAFLLMFSVNVAARDDGEISNDRTNTQVRLPVSGLTVMNKGKTPVIISDNGRYVATVALYDNWTGRYVNTPDDADYSISHIDPQRLHLEAADLFPITVGTGQDVIVFADPLCQHCRELFRKIYDLSDSYSFHVVLIPTLGEQSKHLVTRYDCADADKAAKSIINGDVSILPPFRRNCRPDATLRRAIAVQLLGIQSVPYLIAPDGRISAGVPDDLRYWLAGEE